MRRTQLTHTAYGVTYVSVRLCLFVSNYAHAICFKCLIQRFHFDCHVPHTCTISRRLKSLYQINLRFTIYPNSIDKFKLQFWRVVAVDNVLKFKQNQCVRVQCLVVIG